MFQQRSVYQWSSMSPQLLVNKHYRLRDSRLSLVWLSGGLCLVAEKTTKKNKPWVDYEPRLAHGLAVKKCKIFTFARRSKQQQKQVYDSSMCHL